MTTQNKVIALVIVVIVVAVLVAIFAFYSPAPKPSPISPIEEEEIVPPPATGNIDDVVDALLKELLDEGAVLTEGENDAALITTDSQEVGDFGQSINESEL